jgi:hypothetical protein
MLTLRWQLQHFPKGWITQHSTRLTQQSQTFTFSSSLCNFFASCSCRWVETMSLNCIYKRAYCSSPRWYMSMKSQGGMILTWVTEITLRKPCLTNPTTDQDTNRGLGGERPPINRPSHSTVFASYYLPLTNSHILTTLLHFIQHILGSKAVPCSQAEVGPRLRGAEFHHQQWHNPPGFRGR